MSEESEPDLATVVGLLDDEYARSVLTATSTEPMSATEIAAECEASVSTVYRRAERLREAGLVTERDRMRSDGHHDTVYLATLDRLSISLGDGTLDLEIQCTTPDREEDPADRLTRLWEEL